MRKIAARVIGIREIYDLCTGGITEHELQNRFIDGSDEFISHSEEYDEKGAAGDLFTILPLAAHKPAENPIVFSDLTKHDLVKLYEYYMRNKAKPGRSAYDKILLSADEKCPFCGGIGRPRNLDHYLPKAYFPQFSITPSNLIPACRDCNMDAKGTSFASTAHEQILHPYLDDNFFFEDQWVYARVIPGDPCSLEFYASPPTKWHTISRQRAERHFHVFDLPIRYGIQAAEELSTVVDQRRGYLRGHSSDEFREYLLSFTESSLFANHWKKVMYQALANDSWFCEEEF
ncbi:MAG: HNH endonuclease [Candidatus Thiodiazotropha endolucinida]|nr:HNH endonuclease [Candidatus Thiodiazotropha taylori]MCW4315769.1 HNH endonuclease [Candidatus Thiodiazotropha taylori]